MAETKSSTKHSLQLNFEHTNQGQELEKT